MSENPKVFISYSHVDEAYEKRSWTLQINFVLKE